MLDADCITCQAACYVLRLSAALSVFLSYLVAFRRNWICGKQDLLQPAVVKLLSEFALLFFCLHTLFCLFQLLFWNFVQLGECCRCFPHGLVLTAFQSVCVYVCVYHTPWTICAPMYCTQQWVIYMYCMCLSVGVRTSFSSRPSLWVGFRVKVIIRCRLVYKRNSWDC